MTDSIPIRESDKESREIHLDLVLNTLGSNPRVRKCLENETWYFNIIDVVAEFRGVNQRSAQNYVHVLIKRLNTNGSPLPGLKPIRHQAQDGKQRKMLCITIEGVKAILDYLKPNIRNQVYREEVRRDDEVLNFHPTVINALRNEGWDVRQHVELASGKVIDLVAQRDQETLIVECKSRIRVQLFFEAVGQVLCYCNEFGNGARPAIAIPGCKTTEYFRERCHNLGIYLIEVSED
jgi:hypothetical protein